MSSIYLKDNTYWYHRYTYNPETGKKDKRVYKSLKTNDYNEGLLRKESLDKKWDEIEEKDRVNPPKPLRVLIDKYLEIRKVEVSQRRRSPITYRSDDISLNQFLDFIVGEYGEMDIRKIQKSHIIDFKDYRWSQPKVKSQTTVSLNLRVIRSFFSFCLDNEWIETTPFLKVKIPKPNKRENYPPTEEFEKITKYFRTEIEKPKTNKPKPTDGKNKKQSKFDWFYENEWFSKLIWLILNSGMRVGETTILKWKPDSDDVGTGHSYSYSYLSDDMKSIHIHFKRRTRVIPIVHLTKMFGKIPRTYMKNENGKPVRKTKKYVFENERTGKPHLTGTVSHLWKKLSVDLEWDTRWTIHSLRHGFTSYLLNHGRDIFVVSKILGHSTLEMMDIYGHTTRDDMVNSFKSLPKGE